MLLNYKCDLSKTKATVSASVTKFNSNYVYKRTAYSSFVVTGITSVKLPDSTICFIKRIASYFIHCILCPIIRYFFFWPLCCLFFFDYEFWLLLWHPQNLLTYERFLLYSLYSMRNQSFIKQGYDAPRLNTSLHTFCYRQYDVFAS